MNIWHRYARNAPDPATLAIRALLRLLLEVDGPCYYNGCLYFMQKMLKVQHIVVKKYIRDAIESDQVTLFESEEYRFRYVLELMDLEQAKFCALTRQECEERLSHDMRRYLR